ncbi:hypothetical protein BHE74_00002190 [Ensete ventricosum]|uniref:Uncharacterized protein n=1 Tax=Ensete ventricosum TaxID=4639 RepID=A0A444ES06_ENSVE|nr:hypothetical protein B296_00026118 [Ensete ventricosum]RWW13192.1 hypothetical protein GW17_00023106 [Ensete ventricosum]RWW88915.1 hypothetical protein BHE74_00002190 [Ensete ventricosum]RZR76037.1 hypothetical protein BHM03_00000641 [Ensete ventricosum]
MERTCHVAASFHLFINHGCRMLVPLADLPRKARSLIEKIVYWPSENSETFSSQLEKVWIQSQASGERRDGRKKEHKFIDSLSDLSF